MVLIAGGDLPSFSQLALLFIIEADPQIACMYLAHATLFRKQLLFETYLCFLL
jgi:hypothetical protein